MGNIFSAIAGALSSFVQAIANVFIAIFKGIAAVLNAIVRFITCGKCGGGRGGHV